MHADDYLVAADPHAARALSDAEVRQALDADPEGALITDYLVGALAPAQAAEVERRLREDEGFRERVGPIVEAWQAWPTARDVSVSAHVVATNWQRFLDEVKRREHEDARARDLAGDAGDGASHRSPGGHRHRLRRWQLAAGMLALVGVPAAAVGGYVLARRLAPPRTFVLEAARESKLARLGDDAWVTVEPGGRLVWDERPSANGVHELFLDGGARIHALGVPDGRLVVITPSARLIVNGAAAYVDASDPARTRVLVDQGGVVAGSRSPRALPLLALGPGEQGVIMWGQPPRRVR